VAGVAPVATLCTRQAALANVPTLGPMRTRIHPGVLSRTRHKACKVKEKNTRKFIHASKRMHSFACIPVPECLSMYCHSCFPMQASAFMPFHSCNPGHPSPAG
jgi:hypothetical protein